MVFPIVRGLFTGGMPFLTINYSLETCGSLKALVSLIVFKGVV